MGAYTNNPTLLLAKKQEEKSTKRFSSGVPSPPTVTKGYRECEYEYIYTHTYIQSIYMQVIEYHGNIRNNEHGEQRQTPESTLNRNKVFR